MLRLNLEVNQLRKEMKESESMWKGSLEEKTVQIKHFEEEIKEKDIIVK